MEKETRKRSFWIGKLEPVKLERKDMRFVAMMKMLRCGLTCHEKTIDVQWSKLAKDMMEF